VFDDILIGSDGPRSEEFMGSQGSDYIDGGGGAHDRDNRCRVTIARNECASRVNRR
jgi:hypothetical protein